MEDKGCKIGLGSVSYVVSGEKLRCLVQKLSRWCEGIRNLLRLRGGECIIAFVCPDRKGQTTYSRDKAFELVEGMIGSS